jgi:hypothetical protein
MVLVEIVERIASGHETQPRTGRAVTERAADVLALQRTASKDYTLAVK